MAKYNKKRRKLSKLIFLFLFLAIIIFIIFEQRVKPIIINIAENKSQRVAALAINNAITEELKNKNIAYDELSLIQRNESGEIIAIETNVTAVNQLKADITLAVQSLLDDNINYEFTVPFGTLLGSDLLVGRGANITLYISISGNALTDIVSNFESAGINQTKHSINVEITANINITMPSCHDTITIVTTVPLAETIIVGDVPVLYSESKNAV